MSVLYALVDPRDNTVHSIGITDESRTIILRVYRLGTPLGEIAKAVGLSGRSYPLFREVCREVDISKKVEDA